MSTVAKAKESFRTKTHSCRFHYFVTLNSLLFFFWNDCKIYSIKTSITSSASVFDLIKKTKEIKLKKPYNTSTYNLEPNQAHKLSSRYIFPFPLTASSFSRMSLSTHLISNLSSLGCSPCLRAFLSLHTLCTRAWKVYRMMNNSVAVKLDLDWETTSRISFHSTQ